MTTLIMSFLFLCIQVSLGQVTEFNINEGSVSIASPGDYLITGNGVTTDNTITVNAAGSTEGSPVNITIRNVNIERQRDYDNGPFSITGYVNLTVEGENNFKSESDAGIRVEGNNTLVITEQSSGRLKSEGDQAGIGGGERANGGTITINGGTVTASGNYGAGIGGGYAGNGGTTTINGGTVTATSTDDGAGIGGGFPQGAGGTIIIHGGTVTAATKREKAHAIGGGGYMGAMGSPGPAGTFSTREGGHAFIIAGSIGDQSGNVNWAGVIFIGNRGEVYGNPILDTKAVIPAGKTLIVEAGPVLTLASGTILAVDEGGTLTNDGTLTNNGTILQVGSATINGTSPTTTVTGYKAIYDSNDGTSRTVTDYVENNTATDNTVFIRPFYTFNEWQDNSTGGTPTTTITRSLTLYAQWTPVPFSIAQPATVTATNGNSYDLSQLLPADIGTTVGGATGYAFQGGSVPDGFSIAGSTVSFAKGTDSNGQDVTFTVTALNTATADVTVKFVINSNITVNQTTGGTISADLTTATEGETVTLSYSEESNYRFTGWKVTRDDTSGEIPVNGNSFTMPASHVTVSATFDNNPFVPPVPEPEPMPTVYHTVTLPGVEGATTDPVAGDYDVEAWSSFRFYLTLSEGYEQSQPVVTTSRDEQLEPRASDGAYIVKYVRNNVEIYIDGIVKNPDPVANETIRENGMKVRAANGCLHIQTPQPEKVCIFTPDGRLLKAFRTTANEERIPLPKGIYLIRGADQCVKVVL